MTGGDGGAWIAGMGGGPCRKGPAGAADVPGMLASVDDIPHIRYIEFMSAAPDKPKTSVYLDGSTRKILSAREGVPPEARRHGRRSRILRDLLIRYDEICRRDLPNLTTDEWKVLIAAGRVWASTAEGLLAPPPIPSLVDTVNRVSPDQVDPAARAKLLPKLLHLSCGQQVAAVDYVERYWAATERSEVPPPIPSDLGSSNGHVASGKRQKVKKSDGTERR